ncbi:MAG: hypothetical protein WD898_02840 [Candidatus Paceibacterota bacterium]
MQPKKPMLVLVAALVLTVHAKADSVPLAIINGEVVSHQESKSITVAIDKTKQVEIGLSNIRTVAVLEAKKISDGVAGTAAVAASTSAGVTIIGSNGEPDTEQRIKDASLVAIVIAGLSATLRAGYNWFNQKEPATIFDARNGLNDKALIENLPVGTRVRITLDMP